MVLFPTKKLQQKNSLWLRTKRHWSCIFFAGRKIMPLREKRLRARSSGVLVNCFHGEKNKPWFIALANFYGVNYLGLFSSYQCDLSGWSWEEIHIVYSQELEWASFRYAFFFLKRGREKRNIAPYVPQPGMEPATELCALTGNWTCSLFGEWEDAPTKSPGQSTTGRREEKEKTFLSKSTWQKSRKVVFIFIFPILVKRFCFNFKCTWLGVWELLYYYFKTCTRSSCIQRGHIISGF